MQSDHSTPATQSCVNFPNSSEDNVGEPSARTTSKKPLIVISKKDFCLFCEKCISGNNIQRHHCRNHHDQQLVKNMMELYEDDPKKNELMTTLRNMGNFKNNIRTLKAGKGMFVVCRETRGHEANDYLPCPYCKSFILKKHLWKHCKRCICKNASVDKFKVFVREGRRLLQGATADASNSKNSVLDPLWSSMHAGDIKVLIKNDEVISRYAYLRMQSFTLPNTKLRAASVNNVSGACRALGRLVNSCRQFLPDCYLTHLLTGQNFETVIEATRLLVFAGSADKNPLTLAQRIGNLLKKAITTKIALGVSSPDPDEYARLQKEATDFDKLYQSDWSFRINCVARRAKQIRDMGTLEEIPISEDLIKFKQFICNLLDTYYRVFVANTTADTYVALVLVLMVRIILFNKRRPHEVAELLVSHYQDSPDYHEDTSFEEGLRYEEKVLAKRFVLYIPVNKGKFLRPFFGRFGAKLRKTMC